MKVLRIGNTVFPVTNQQYKDYYQELERWKYIKRREKGKKLSLEKAIMDKLPLELLSGSGTVSAEDEAEKNILTEQLNKAIELLDEDERILIRQLFFDGKSARGTAQAEGVYHSTIVYRRNQVLKKLKKLMGF